MADLVNRIAVVGMACRFPGATSLEGYWELLQAGRSAIQRFSPQELLAGGIPPDLVEDP